MKVNYACYFGPIRKLTFLKTFSNIFYQTNRNFFKGKLSKIKASLNTTLMQILRHVTDMWAEVVGITITRGSMQDNFVCSFQDQTCILLPQARIVRSC